jgi:hypothetical protein
LIQAYTFQNNRESIKSTVQHYHFYQFCRCCFFLFLCILWTLGDWELLNNSIHFYEYGKYFNFFRPSDTCICVLNDSYVVWDLNSLSRYSWFQVVMLFYYILTRVNQSCSVFFWNVPCSEIYHIFEMQISFHLKNNISQTVILSLNNITVWSSDATKILYHEGVAQVILWCASERQTVLLSSDKITDLDTLIWF